MAADDDRDPEAEVPAHRHLKWLVIVPVVLLIPFFGWLISSCLSARTVAKGFVTAVREQRYDDARAALGPELRAHAAKGDVPADEPARSLVRVLRSTNPRWGGVVQNGFGDHFEPFACFDGHVEDEKTFWMVMRKVHGVWRIVDLRMAEPEICKGSE